MRISAILPLFCVLILSGCIALIPLVDEKLTPQLPSTHIRAQPQHLPQRLAPAKRAQRPLSNLADLEKRLDHRDAVVRAHAAFWIGEQGRSAVSVVPALVARLHSDPNHWVRRACAKALGKIGSPLAIEPLRAALSDRNRYVAHSAANALRKLDTTRARLALAHYSGR